jgi:hypothetical protein
MFALTGFLGHRCWWWHLLTIQKSFSLFQIVSGGTMDLAPLFYVSKVIEQSFLLLIQGLLLAISVISAIPMVSMIGCIYLPIVLLLLRGPLAM